MQQFHHQQIKHTFKIWPIQMASDVVKKDHLLAEYALNSAKLSKPFKASSPLQTMNMVNY